MRHFRSALLALLIAVVIHVDWHLARPAHHRLSLAWSQHWLFAALAFALAGWVIARRWPERPWRAATALVGAGVIVGQIVEPVLESLFYLGTFGYPVEPERWRAFVVCLAAGVPALALTLVLCRPRAAHARDARTPLTHS